MTRQTCSEPGSDATSATSSLVVGSVSLANAEPDLAHRLFEGHLDRFDDRVRWTFPAPVDNGTHGACLAFEHAFDPAIAQVRDKSTHTEAGRFIPARSPEEDVLDQPVALEPIGPSMPLRAVLGAPELPAGQPVSPKLFAGGFSFPYTTTSLPLPPENCQFVDGQLDKHCHHKGKTTTPEPPTMILFASGLAAIGWRSRRNKGLLGV